jgi:AraC family transcriptional regulator, regulatory protein of adaptative response / methylated-DNA-[protein]-cysteine methyltransferase
MDIETRVARRRESMTKTTMRALDTSSARPAMIDAEASWAAVISRDARSDGQFVYAVSTTGVYCRPTCPSRRPLRGNVAFFAGPDEAEAAGYRGCRRCHPRSAQSAAARAVEQARGLLDASDDRRVTLDVLARAVGLSPFHLQRTFKRLTGVTPKEYAAARRAERLKTRLRKGDTVSRATYEAGYGSNSRVYEKAHAQLGMTPATYRRGGHGIHIRYTIVDSALGRLLVGATEQGVCAVTMGDEERSLEAALRQEYPKATLERTDEMLGGWVEAIVRQLEGTSASLSIPTDVEGTAFQRRVWKALREIPAGETRSYSEVAASIGSPTSARAVARACATNRVAVVIPCHRVVRQGGALGGYRWGLERKKRLLEREKGNND